MEKRADHDYSFVTFESKIGSNLDEKCYGIIQTSDGGYAVIGTSVNSGTEKTEMYLVKVDDKGVQDWAKTYKILSDDSEGAALMATADNGFVLLGNSNKSGADWQFYMVRTTSDGSVSWEYDYGWIKEDKGSAIFPKPTGGYLLLGYSGTWETGDAASKGIETILFDIDSDGGEKVRYNNDFGTLYNDYGHYIISTSDNNYLLLATYEDQSSNKDLHIIKLSGEDLSVEWDQPAISNCLEVNNCVRQLSDGSFVVLGAVISGSSTVMQLVKLSSNGQTTSWSKTYSNTDSDFGASLELTADGGFILLSSSMVLVKTDINGNELWRKDFEGTTYGNNCVMQVADGGYILAGNVNNNGNQDIYIIKTDQQGNLGFRGN